MGDKLMVGYNGATILKKRSPEDLLNILEERATFYRLILRDLYKQAGRDCRWKDEIFDQKQEMIVLMFKGIFGNAPAESLDGKITIAETFLKIVTDEIALIYKNKS